MEENVRSGVRTLPTPGRGRVLNVQQGQRPPAGAVMMREAEVVHYFRQLVAHHSPKQEVIGVRHGSAFVGLAASVGSYVVNSLFRDSLRIPLKVGFVASYLPSVFLSSFAAALLHKGLVQDPLVLGDLPCSLCAEIRGGVIQVAAGFLYPMLFCPFSSLFLARRHNTYPLTPEGVRVLPLLRSLVRPRTSLLTAICCSQILVGMLVSSREAFEVRRLWFQHSDPTE